MLNVYMDHEAPWKLNKEGRVKEMETVLYSLADQIRCIAILLQPFCPTAASKLLDQLAVPTNERTFAHLTAEYALKPGTPLPAPEGVFPRLQTVPKEGMKP
jgi:methionyl-tRNA synthetase